MVSPLESASKLALRFQMPFRSLSRFEITAAFLVAAVGAFFCLTLREGQWFGSDASLYIIHARNIAEGLPYNDTGFIHNPGRVAHSPATYPPVFPTLLAPVYAVFGLNLTAMKLEIIAFFLVFLIIAIALFRRDLGEWPALTVVALVGFAPLFWSHKDDVLSEIPFMMIAYATLLYICRAHNSGRSVRQTVLQGLVAGLLIYLANGTRTIGITLIPSLLAMDLLRIRRVSLFSGVACSVSVALLLGQEALLADASTYIDTVQLSFARVLANVERYARGFARTWYAGFPVVIGAGLFAGACLLVLIGYVSRFRREITILETFFAVFVAAVVLYPLAQGFRYMMPVVPLFLFYAYAGAQTVVAAIGKARLQQLVYDALIIPIVLSHVISYAWTDFGPLPDGYDRPDVVELLDYVRLNTSSDDVFIFGGPRTLALLARRPSATYDSTLSDAEQWAYLESIDARYIIARPTADRDRSYLYPFVQNNSDRIDFVMSTGGFDLYEIRAGRF